ncbi:AI-2 transport protein TqsA [Elusimicrobium posterum]|uniref:AI-2E family transporter n=1 Tax=Elusimicrobium posterum TaxID=3116653 RepID=UPI003C79567A
MNEHVISNSKINTACLLFLAGVAFTITLKFTKAAMMPFVIAVLVYTIFSPLIRYLKHKTKMPQWLSLSLLFSAIAALAVLSVVFIYNSIGSFVAGADIYKDRLLAIADWALSMAAKYKIHLDTETVMDTVRRLPVFNIVRSVSTLLISLTTNFFMVVIFLLFLFIGNGKKTPAEGESKQEIKEKKEASATVKDIQDRISYYITIKTIVSLATGIVVWIILAAFGVELAFMFGFLTFLLNYIPNVGSIVAVLLPIPVIFLQYGFGGHFIAIMSLAIAAQFIIGNIIEPKVLGDGIDLHPVAVICALVFWSIVWGLAGAFLAVPLTVAIKEVLFTLEPTKPFAELLAGRF